MFLQLNHYKLDIYKASRSFVRECYKVTQAFPTEERFAMVSQIRRAALSVHLNICEGCSRTSLTERKRYFHISRGSLVEIDAAIDLSVELGFTATANLETLGDLIIRCFSMLSKLIGPGRL